MAALTAGEVQLDLTAGVDVIQAISGGAPLKLIGYFDNHSPYGIFALADIKEPADLKGKTVAVGKIGDTSDVGLRIGLKQLGLSANDVKLLQTGNSPERWAALTSKQVQGAILDADTFAKLAEAQGVRMLLNMKPQPYVATALVIQDSFGKSNPRTIDASLRGLIDGVKYFADPKNESEVKAALGRELKREVSDPQVAATYESVTGRLSPDPFPEQAGVDAILGALRDIDPRYGSLTAGQIIDASYMQRVRGTK
jgi:ABC-type nitrate/sulfonate/bicarbonate transport system substrate-binding protein